MRYLLLCLTGLVASTAVAAERAEPPAAKSEQPAEQARPVVIAAAAEAPMKLTAAEQKSDAAAPKPRRGRVTSCRCGDQLPND